MLKKRLLSHAALAAGLVLCAAFSSVAHADNYPSKPVRLVVGFAPGGPVDLGARLVAEHLTRELGQTFIVENKPGANAAIAAMAVKSAPADGYTAYVTSSSSITLNPHLFKNTIRYNPKTDFQPVATITEMPLILVINNNEPMFKDVKNLKDLVEVVRKNPSGKLAYGSAGIGNITQIAFELLSSRAGIKMNHVPYKGTADAQKAILAREVLMVFDSMSAIPHIKNGSLRPLAISSNRRIAALPDVPTVQEQGFGDFDVASWVGIFVPKATPADVVQRLSQKVLAAGKDPAVVARLSAVGPILSLDAAAFSAKIDKESAELLRVIETAGIKVQD